MKGGKGWKVFCDMLRSGWSDLIKVDGMEGDERTEREKGMMDGE